MSIYTFVVEFKNGLEPAIAKNTDILGGELHAVQFSDALAELKRVTEQRDELLEALEFFVKQWNTCGPNSDFGRYFSSARNAAVAAIARATGNV